MKQAIILHGMPDKEDYLDPNKDAETHCHWLPWLQRQLIVNGVLAQTPEMPEPYLPRYPRWCEVFEQFKVDANTDLVGHSCGGGFLLRWLSENKMEIGKLVLVAPWIDPANELGDSNDFFNFEIDPALPDRTNGVYIINSSNDDAAIQKSVENIANVLEDAELTEIKDKGHFTLSDMGTREFPELTHILLGEKL
jgi:hypothetical protein